MGLLSKLAERVSSAAMRYMMASKFGSLNGALLSLQQLSIAQKMGIAYSGDTNPATSAQLAANEGWAFAANRQIGGRAGRIKIELSLCSRDETGEVVETRIFDHTFLDLWERPNYHESSVVFLWRMVTQMNTAGRAFVLVTPEIIQRPSDGRVIAYRFARMRLLLPDAVIPFGDAERPARYYAYTDPQGTTGYQEYIPAPATNVEIEEWRRDPKPFVFPVQLPATDSDFGKSPIEAVGASIDNERSLEKMWNNQLKNGLHSSLIFYLLKDIDNVDRFANAVLLVKSGLAKAGQPMILPKKTVEVAPSPLNNNDMQFASLAELSRKKILAVLGSSDGMVGIVEDVNRASIEGLERMIALGTIDPLLTLVSEAFNLNLMPLYRGQSDRTWLSVRFPSAATFDDVTVTEMLVKQVGNKQIKTQNEARKELKNLPPKPGGDKLDTEKKSNPFDMPGVGGKPGGFGAFGKDKPVNKQTQPEPMHGEPFCGDCATHERTFTVGENQYDRLRADHPMRDPAQRDAAYDTIDEQRYRWEKKFRMAIAPTFREWAAAVKREIKRNGPHKLAPQLRAEQNDVQPDAYRRQLMALYFAYMPDFMVDAANTTAEDLDSEIRFTLDSAGLYAFTKRRSEAFALKVTDTQRKYILAALERAQEEGLDNDDMADLVDDTFPSVDRLSGMASVEVGIAAGFASYLMGGEISEQEERNIGVMWLTRRDKDVRDTHREVDGLVVDLGDVFRVGECYMRYPKDSDVCDLPEELCECRCVPKMVDL